MNDSFQNGVLVGTLMTWCFVIAIAVCGGFVRREIIEREAVQNGAATWTVDDEGKRVFKWRDAK